MKMCRLLAVVLAMVVLGCGRSNNDRVVDLEKRIALLEGRFAVLERQSLEPGMRMSSVQRIQSGKDGEVSRRVPLTPEQIAERQRLKEDVRKRLETRRDKARAKKQSDVGAREPVRESSKE